MVFVILFSVFISFPLSLLLLMWVSIGEKMAVAHAQIVAERSRTAPLEKRVCFMFFIGLTFNFEEIFHAFV